MMLVQRICDHLRPILMAVDFVHLGRNLVGSLYVYTFRFDYCYTNTK
jgi:hypothetical protein